MTNNKNHPFHLVDNSPWPLTGSLGALTMTSGMIMWFHKKDPSLFMLGLIICSLTGAQWWRDITREATYQGKHTIKVADGMKIGMILFITSEVFFFASFFWVYYSAAIEPNIEIGMKWPPLGITTFDPMGVPLLNCAILLTSGKTATWAHHSLMNGNHKQTTQALVITVMLGMYFTVVQALEYHEASFTMSDSIYGSCFFMMTGFHGIHVIIGTTFLVVILVRHMKSHFSKIHHVGFELAAWYWHFVDVVWMLLYISVYCWGN